MASIFPAFWDWLTENSPDTVASVHAVGKELLLGNESLAEWTASQGDQFVLRPDSAVEQACEAVGNWAAGCGCDLEAIRQFMQCTRRIVSSGYGGRPRRPSG